MAPRHVVSIAELMSTLHASGERDCVAGLIYVPLSAVSETPENARDPADGILECELLISRFRQVSEFDITSRDVYTALCMRVAVAIVLNISVRQWKSRAIHRIPYVGL
ncbi:uncharacterized protein JN550_007638 [Neoarthrinium moseri]|uniref:uncharacterized protein n=1 Tax=Neoarthrinium moseri TaxID=1658444 RepID=UPI001FDD17A6|nr:uncharacterized protein JN550_007638 [Neoarthrinium moseri]KAI1866250.1 hypothetical protein JN550_007638 [Neoarthrinium moseri]